MDALQRLEIRKAETAASLAELAGRDDLDETGQAKMKELVAAVKDLEERHAAALTAKSATPAPPLAGPVGNLPAKDREFTQLEERVSLGRYIQASLDGRVADGAEAEYSSAVIPGAEPGRIPLRLLEERQTQTSSVTGDEPTQPGSSPMWRPVLARLFNIPVTQALGITMTQVPSGEAVFVTTTDPGTTPAMRAEAAAVAESTVTLETQTLSPTRLSAYVRYSGEVSMLVPQIEQIVRRDIREAVSDKIEEQVLIGNGTSPNVEGLTHGATLATNPTAVSGWTEILNLANLAVDGVWCNDTSQVNVLMPIEASVFSAGIYQTQTTELSALQVLRNKTRGVYASAHLPRNAGSPAARSDTSDIYLFRNNGRQFAAMPVWDSFSVIRDIYSDAPSAMTRLVAHFFWSMALTRPAARTTAALKLA